MPFLSSFLPKPINPVMRVLNSPKYSRWTKIILTTLLIKLTETTFVLKTHNHWTENLYEETEKRQTNLINSGVS